MNEINLVVPTVIKVCYSPKSNGQFNSFSIEEPIVGLEDPMARIMELHRKLKEQVDKAFPVETTLAVETPKYNKPQQALGKCHCGANMVNNPRTGKNFCENKCWLKK